MDKVTIEQLLLNSNTFSPYVEVNKHHDYIIVHLEDVSYCEKSINKELDIYLANHSSQIAGFVIYNISKKVKGKRFHLIDLLPWLNNYYDFNSITNQLIQFKQLIKLNY